MELLDRLRDFIKGLETADLYKYGGAFFGALFLLLGLLIYVHYSKVTKYKQELKNVETLRTQTKKILSDYKAVTLQKQAVEDILAQNRDFRIGEAFQTIVQKVGLFGRGDQTAPTTGETVSGMTEVQISANFNSISMKQLTDLLLEIAQVPQLYAKELTVKKVPQASAIDVDIMVATLEPSTE